MRCLIIDDHPFMSAGVSALLNIDFPECVITTVTTVGAALDHIKMDNNKLTYLILLDLVLPDANGIEVLKYLQNSAEKHEHLCIVISGVHDQETVALCKRLGARGYISKTEDLNLLSIAIRTVYEGGEYFSVGQANSTLGNFLDNTSQLSNRQRDVLDLVIAGYSNKKISEVLPLTYGTIKNYIRDLMAVFSVKSRLELATNARISGYVPKSVKTNSGV